jgi:hypothetical protein
MKKLDVFFGVLLSILIMTFVAIGTLDGLSLCTYNKEFVQKILEVIIALEGGYFSHRIAFLKLGKTGGNTENNE